VRLYDFPFAPNPKKVRVYLAEKGLAIPLVPVNLVKGEHCTPEFLAVNPRGALPVLELDDGTRLTESLAIIEYLEELHPEPPMIGTTPLERARVRAAERRCELGVLGRVARLFHATRAVLPGARPDPAAADLARGELAPQLAALDAEIGAGPFVCGPRPTIADCTLFAALEMARMGKLDVALGSQVAAWYARFRERPSASA
jgi:glutathione S-transferase